MRNVLLGASVLALLACCAPREAGTPESTTASPGGVLTSTLKAEPAEFKLADHREIKVVYSLLNTSRRLLRLDFPTGQHLEVTMRGPGGQRLFLWSEDRSFAAAASSVVVNPGERLEYEAGIPTRDMAAGSDYTVEAVLPGYAETAASVILRPR
jgi:hypothetical protein